MGLSVPSMPFPFDTLIISLFTCPEKYGLLTRVHKKKNTIFKIVIPKKLVVAYEGDR